MGIKLYAAPMEGMTTYLWRRIHHEIFGGADKYFTPFLSPNDNESFQRKELDELRHNEGLIVVPQILANSARHVLWAARELAKMGYEEINFNLGCPAGTVTAKRKGAGALRDLSALSAMLEEIFAGLPRGMRLSVKTRVGWESTAEWPEILQVYQRFPISELIVHSRVQKELYRGQAHRELLKDTLEKSQALVCWNGDIFAPQQAKELANQFPKISALMTGRGLMADPALLRRIRGGAPAAKEELRRYHDALYDAYRERMGSDLNAIYRMRELWNYLSGSFLHTEQFLKKVRKVRSRREYFAAVDRLFSESETDPHPLPPAVK